MIGIYLGVLPQKEETGKSEKSLTSEKVILMGRYSQEQGPIGKEVVSCDCFIIPAYACLLSSLSAVKKVTIVFYVVRLGCEMPATKVQLLVFWVSFFDNKTSF